MTSREFEEKLRRWIATPPVQVVIGIDIAPTTTMELIILERNSDFDEDHSNAADPVIETREWFHDRNALPTDPVVIPWTALYHGVALPQTIVDAQNDANAGVAINFDALRRRIAAERTRLVNQENEAARQAAQQAAQQAT